MRLSPHWSVQHLTVRVTVKRLATTPTFSVLRAEKEASYIIMADASGPLDTFFALTSEAGISVEDLEHECGEHDLRNLADVCDPWELIGRHLRLKEADISAIKENHYLAELRRLEMLRKWRNTTLRPTYRMLIEAFLRSNMTQQALSICKKIKRLYSEDSINTRQVTSREQWHNVSSVPMSFSVEGTAADHTVHTSLKESIQDLELKFSDVQRQFVRADGVTLEELKECVATLPSFKSTSPAQLLRSVSVYEFFHYLKDYCNTQSHDILDDLIQMLGDNETKKKMSDFKTKYKAFQKRVKLKDFVGKYEGHMTTPANYKELEMKLGENWREKTLEDLEILRRQISLEAWLFMKIEEGCFIVKYLVPRHENLLLDDMNAYLHNQNVLYILIDKKPVFTSKQVTHQEGLDHQEREYMAQLFYFNHTLFSNEIYIHVVVTWNDETHLTVVKEEYLQNKRALPGPVLPVDFESEQIELDIPEEGLTLDEGWTITPLIPPLVSKKHVDSYQPHKRIPHCELLAEFESATAETRVTPLCHRVKLLGAKQPYNMLILKPPTITVNRPISFKNNSGGNIVMLRDEHLSLFEKLKEGDIDENIRHLKYKFENFSISAIEELKEKSATNEMLLENLKELQSSLVQPKLGEVGGSTVMKDEPSSTPVEYQQLETATTQSQIKQDPVDEDVLPSDVGDSTADTSSQLALDLSPPPTEVMDIVPSSQLTSAAGFAGVEVCAETTLVVTNNPQSFIWKGYGLKIYIPQGCLPKDVDKCKVKIQTSLSGLYEFPDNSFLVSAVFWLRCEPQCKFSVPISMEIQHCARAENVSKLSFVKAYCSQKSLPYTFRAVAGGRFSSSCSYGILELDSFSGVAVTQEGTEEREYIARLFYLNQALASNEIHIHVVVTWNDKAHITAVKEEYLQEKRASAGSDLLVDFESEQIALDIPEKGLTLDEGWIITPLIPPVVSKKHVDSYQPHKRIPHCELLAEFESASTETRVTPLCHRVKLLGAKKPYNMFTIKPPLSGMGNVTYNSSLGQSSSTKRTQQSTSGPNRKRHKTTEGPSEVDRTRGLQSSPTLKQLLKELNYKAADWEDMGILLDINDGDLKQLKSDNRDDSKACLRDMLRIWLNRVDPPPSWSAIADAVEDLGDKQLPHELRSKYAHVL